MKPSPALLAFILALTAGGAAAQDRPSPPSVTVVGEASDEAQPDVAWISLTVRDRKPTAAEAANDNAHRAEAVIAALMAAGAGPKDIVTVGLAVSPVWSDGAGPRSVAAYEATNRLSIRVQPVDRAGAIIAQAASAGAEYEGVGFDLSDRDARQDGLRAKAVENAAHRAALYAEGAGMKLGPLMLIQAQGAQNAFRPLVLAWADVAGGVTPPPIEPGPIRLSDSVTASWTLELR